jgi:hypothetical protein
MKNGTALVTFTIVFCFALMAGTAHAQWTSAVTEEVTSGSNFDHLGDNAVLVDDAGTLHAVFDRIDDDPEYGHNLYYIQKPINGSWSTPFPIGDHNQLQSYASMTIDKASGTLYVAYFEGEAFLLGIFDGVTWDYVELTVPAEYGFGDADVEFGPLGNLHLTFLAHHDITEVWTVGYGYWDGTEFHFQVLDEVTLIEAGRFTMPAISVRSDGSVAIIYRNMWQYMEFRVEVAENSSLGGSDWTYHNLNIPGPMCYAGPVVTTPNDDIHVAIQIDLEIPFPGQIYYNHKAAGSGTWDGAQMVSGSFNARIPGMVVEDDGTVHIVCHETSGLHATGNLIYITNGSGAWTQQYIVQGNAEDPSLDMDSSGNCSMIYRVGLEYYADNDIFYYGFVAPPGPAGTVAAAIDCEPSSGVVPFQTAMTVTLENLYDGQARRMAARIDATLASGSFFPSWRAGYTNVDAGDSFVINWMQSIPALGSVIGDNVFAIVAEDVTPSPYNQPPYPSAGDTASDSCTVTGELK